MSERRFLWGRSERLRFVAPIFASAIGLLIAFAGGAIAASKITRSSPIREAKTFVLPMVPPSRVEVLKVGESFVTAACDESGDATQVGVSAGSTGADYAGFTTPDFPTFPVRMQHLNPGEGELFYAPGAGDSSDQSIQLGPFAIFDGKGAAASGTLGFFVDHQRERCVITVQAAG